MSASKLSKNHHYGCIGRDEKQKEVIEVWQKGNKRIFNCYGEKESGKSCFIRNCLDKISEIESSDSIIIDADFKRDRIGPKDSHKFWTNLAKHLARVKVAIEIAHPMTEEILENVFEQIKERKIIFLLDNLDYARNAKADDKSSKTEKDLFSELQDNFVPGIVERTDLSMVFITSTVQLRYGQIAPTVHKIEMEPLSTESAGDLLVKTIELTSDMDNKAARTHLGPYLEPIALLSKGIPMAVIVTDMGKNDLGKPFIGYSHESLLGRTQESNLTDFPEQRMQNLKLSEKDADQDSHSSLNPVTPNEEIQGVQTQDYILPGQLAEEVSRFNYNVSHMPPSMERSPQSIAHAGFIYQENDIFKCQYCEAQIHRSLLAGNVDIMQKHREISPRCSFVRQDQEYLGQNSSQQVIDMGAWKEKGTEFLWCAVTENGQKTNGMDTKNDICDKSYLANSYVVKQYPQSKMDSLERHHTSPKEGKYLVAFKPPGYEPFPSTLFMEKNIKRSEDEGYESPYNSDNDGPPDMVGDGSPHTSDNVPTDPMAMKDQESSKPQHEPQKEKDVDYDNDASSKKGTTHGKLLTQQPQCFLTSGTQSVIERQQDFKADVYTLSWHCYPRVKVLMQQLNSIKERCRKIMDCYNTFRQNLTQQRQFLPTRVTIVDMKRDPQILVIGDLRGEFTMKNIACNTDQLKDDLPFKTTTLRNWTQYYHCPEDPAVIVFIVLIFTEDDFLRCLNNFNHILGQPYHVIGVIEMGPHINRQSEQYLHFNSVVARYNEQCWNQEVKVQTFSVILDDQLVKEKVPGKISECFELEVVTSLSLIEDSLKKNIRDEDFISLVKFEQAGFIKNINDAVTNLFTCDDRYADAVWDRFQKGSMTLQAQKEIITEVHLQAIRKGMVNELSRSTGIMPEIMERLVDQADFEPLCKASIQDSTGSILIKSILSGLTGYSCEHLRNPEERKRFWKLIKKRNHSKYSDILINDLIIVIENTARKIILKELEKNLAIQKKLHFEVVSLLKRTVVKDKFEHLLPAGELPSDDLFGIGEVEGFGIVYNKLHIHIKLKNPEDEEKVCEQIRAKLCNYHHPYRIVVIEDSKASVCVGESLYAFYQNRLKELAY